MIARGSLRMLGLIGCCALFAASCSLSRTPAQPGISRPRIAEATQLAQLDAGRQAVFARCTPPACPTRSQKTLALGTAGQSIDASPQTAVPTKPPSLAAIVQFARGSSRLNAAGRYSLDETASDLLSAHRISIIGRTDSTGEVALNEKLALARAYTVRDHLLKTHPSLAARIVIQAQGSCCFIATNDTVTGRAKNRRVEVTFHANEKDRT